MAVFVAPTVPFVRTDRHRTDTVTVGWPTAFGAAVGRALGVLRRDARVNSQAADLPDATPANAGDDRTERARRRPT